MPKQYFDEDANPIELPTPEEIEELRSGGIKLKEEKDELAKKMEEKEKELTELRVKDRNWKRLRDMTEKEKEELSAKDRMIMEQQEQLQQKQDELEKHVYETTFNRLMSQIVGSDQGMRDKVMEQYDRIKDEAKTEAEISKKLEDARLLVTRDGRKFSFSKAYNVSGLPPRDNKDESQDSKEIRSAFRIKEDAVKKYSGEWEPKI